MATAEHSLSEHLREPGQAGVRAIGPDSSNRVARFVVLFRVAVAALLLAGARPGTGSNALTVRSFPPQ